MILKLLFWGAIASISILAVLPDYNALPPVVSINDLMNHAVAFLTLTLLYYAAYQHSFKRIIITLFSYGCIIEIVQVFLPTRFASIEDIIADSIGILFGWMVVRIFQRIQSLRITPKG